MPLGYAVENRKLVIVEQEAATVRLIFTEFIKLRSATLLARWLTKQGITTRRGNLIHKGFICKLINNRVYIGDAVHKGTAYPSEQQAIISKDIWNIAHSLLQESPRTRAAHIRTASPALLRGLIFAPSGLAMTPTHTMKKGRRYHYYVTTSVINLGPDSCPIRRVPAALIEGAVIAQVRSLLQTPELRVKTWLQAREVDETISENDIRKALFSFNEVWDELFPAEQARIIQLLVERVDVAPDAIKVQLRTSGLLSIARDIQVPTRKTEAVDG